MVTLTTFSNYIYTSLTQKSIFPLTSSNHKLFSVYPFSLFDKIQFSFIFISLIFPILLPASSNNHYMFHPLHSFFLFSISINFFISLPDLSNTFSLVHFLVSSSTQFSKICYRVFSFISHGLHFLSSLAFQYFLALSYLPQLLDIFIQRTYSDIL